MLRGGGLRVAAGRVYLGRLIVVCYEFYFKNDESVHDCRLSESSGLYLRDTFTDSERWASFKGGIYSQMRQGLSFPLPQ